MNYSPSAQRQIYFNKVRLKVSLSGLLSFALLFMAEPTPHKSNADDGVKLLRQNAGFVVFILSFCARRCHLVCVNKCFSMVNIVLSEAIKSL